MPRATRAGGISVGSIDGPGDAGRFRAIQGHAGRSRATGREMQRHLGACSTMQGHAGTFSYIHDDGQGWRARSASSPRAGGAAAGGRAGPEGRSG